MPKTTVQEIPSAVAEKPPRAAKPDGVSWPSHIPVVGDLDAGSNAEWLDSTTEDDWAKHLICYCWRCEPITDRKAGGAPTSVDKLTRKFDYKEILKLHGSGRYRFDVSYRPPNGGKQTRVRQWYETIFDMSHPPKLPLGDWIEDPRNKDWAWAKTDLEAAERLRVLHAQGVTPAAPSQSKTEELGELLTIAEKLNPKDNGNQAILLKLLEQSGPANMLDMAGKLAYLRQPEKNGDSQITLLLLEHLLKRENPPPPADPIETTSKLLTGMKGIFEGMGVMNNGASAAPVKMDTTGLVVQGASDILSKAIEQFGPYVPAAIDLFRHIKDRDLQIAQVSAQRGMNPAQPWQFQGGPNQPTVPQTPAPIAAPQPAPVEGAPMTPMVFLSKHKPLLDEMYPLFKHWFDDQNGYYVADWIIDHKGRDAYDAVRKDASVDMLMVIVANVPQLNVIFQPPQDAREFFTELLCDPDNRPEEIEGEAEGQPQ